jgi:hypothetical protein
MKDVHRLDVKSAEQNFLSEVEYDFELAPGVSRSILESVKYHFDPEYFQENGLSKNRVPIDLVSSDEPAGKPLLNRLSQNSSNFYNWIMDNFYFKYREDIFPNYRYKLTL